MEPISIKLTKDRLAAICQIMEVINFSPTREKRVRADRSIFSEVRTKLFKKLMDREHRPEDFKLKLKYHEAYHLEQYLRDWLWNEAPSLTATLVRMVADELDQKMT